MKNKRNKLVTGLLLAMVLAAAFFLGGDYAAPDAASFFNGHEPIASNLAGPEIAADDPAGDVSGATADGADSAVSPDGSTAPALSADPAAASADPRSASIGTASSPDKASPAAVTTAGEEPSAVAPPPAENDTASTASNSAHSGICFLSVNCSTILDHQDSLEPAKAGLIPSDGVILATQEASFNPGESVFTVLSREMKRHHIHFEFEVNPVYNSAYIEGIANIYEFDCGELSGWTYRVNGSYPGYGCSQYLLEEGDIVEIVYTCDLGRDIGGYISGVYN